MVLYRIVLMTDDDYQELVAQGTVTVKDIPITEEDGDLYFTNRVKAALIDDSDSPKKLIPMEGAAEGKILSCDSNNNPIWINKD